MIEPCRHCGSNAAWNPKEVKTGQYDDDFGYVDCVLCGIRTPGRMSKEVAIAAWNRRSSPDSGGAVKAEVSFLLDRLAEFEQHLFEGEVSRQFYWHVAPSIERLAGLFATPSNGAGGDLLATMLASVEEAKRMTPEQARKRLTDEGFLDEHGELRPEYGGKPPVASGEGPKRKHSMTLDLTSEELTALEELARKQQMTPWRVLVQGLKHYQLFVNGTPDLGPLATPSTAKEAEPVSLRDPMLILADLEAAIRHHFPPLGEPVAWRSRWSVDARFSQWFVSDHEPIRSENDPPNFEVQPLYLHPAHPAPSRVTEAMVEAAAAALSMSEGVSWIGLMRPDERDAYHKDAKSILTAAFAAQPADGLARRNVIEDAAHAAQLEGSKFNDWWNAGIAPEINAARRDGAYAARDAIRALSSPAPSGGGK